MFHENYGMLREILLWVNIRVYRGNQKYLCLKLAGYDDIDTRKVWSSCCYMYCTSKMTCRRTLCKPFLNHLTPNGHYMGRTAQLTSRCCILYIYSTNIRTEYFKHAAYSPFFSSSKCRLFHNATFFGSCIIHILNTGFAKI